MVWRDNMGTLSGRAKLVINSIKADTDRTHRIRKSFRIKLELRVGNRKFLLKNLFNFYWKYFEIVLLAIKLLAIVLCNIGQYYLFSLVRVLTGAMFDIRLYPRVNFTPHLHQLTRKIKMGGSRIFIFSSDVW